MCSPDKRCEGDELAERMHNVFVRYAISLGLFTEKQGKQYDQLPRKVKAALVLTAEDILRKYRKR